MCLLPNVVISAARRTLWPHDYQIIQARQCVAVLSGNLSLTSAQPRSQPLVPHGPTLHATLRAHTQVPFLTIGTRLVPGAHVQEHEQMLRQRQLTKHGGSKMHLIGAEPPYQLW